MLHRRSSCRGVLAVSGPIKPFSRRVLGDATLRRVSRRYRLPVCPFFRGQILSFHTSDHAILALMTLAFTQPVLDQSAPSPSAFWA
ncbi:hypothetical protein BDZ89DRAFT_1158430 [Hymenopellis radicata]|nr:hypothetical protein BDZ89DRAFT_1158430 [Hymenopellis radicata]